MDKETNDEYLPFLLLAEKHVSDAINNFESPNKSIPSIWAKEDIVRERLSLELAPYIDGESDIDDKIEGDKIKICFKEKELSSPIIELTGYSIMDENSYYLRRFYIPKIFLGFNNSTEMNNASTNPNLDIYTGKPKTNRLDWTSKSNKTEQPNCYMMGGSNWICDKGEFVFLRNPNRRIVMCSFWDKENGKTIDLLSKDKNGNYLMNKFMDDLKGKHPDKLIDIKSFDWSNVDIQ